jgi:hypothetical protein
MGADVPGDDGVNPVRITGVAVDDERIEFNLSDGRRISAPVSWSRRLASASPVERAEYSISPSGTVVEWPSVDEHIALWSMLRVPEQVVLEASGFERSPGSSTA